MQYKTLALSLFAAGVAAQNLTSLPGLISQLPPCAIPCFKRGAQAAGCSTTDFQCLCGKGKNSFITGAGGCVLTSCNGDTLNSVIPLATQICADVSNNPNPSDVASASALVTSALGATSPTASPDAAVGLRPEMGLGIMGVIAAMLAL
ncbi:hypothetical protein F5Y14DRAFT_430653 [Nemania sp. NC0429]|nr:hypothetical protein F5Y14DRAFT_430653 [Nemania sp. NC0429]